MYYQELYFGFFRRFGRNRNITPDNKCLILYIYIYIYIYTHIYRKTLAQNEYHICIGKYRYTPMYITSIQELSSKR